MKKIGIIGMGALGLLFGGKMLEASRDGRLDAQVSFLMDDARLARYAGARYTVNGVEADYPRTAPRDFGAADLILFATKYTGLPQAIECVAPSVKHDTVFLSVLNGISSERMIAERYGAGHVLYAVAQEMDAQRTGESLRYVNAGRILMGVPRGGSAALQRDLEAVAGVFDRSGIHYAVEKDIESRLWSKLMLNVGINQTCMLFDTGYGGALVQDSAARAVLVSAMREVIPVANRAGVPLNENDLAEYLAIVGRLSPEALPSMAQDRRARRPSEVDIFAGEIIRQGRAFGIPTPVNDWILSRVREIERGYA